MTVFTSMPFLRVFSIIAGSCKPSLFSPDVITAAVAMCFVACGKKADNGEAKECCQEKKECCQEQKAECCEKQATLADTIQVAIDAVEDAAEAIQAAVAE